MIVATSMSNIGRCIAVDELDNPPDRRDLRGIVRARRLSIGNIRQNWFFAFVYNVLGVPVAAGVLYPFLGLAQTRVEVPHLPGSLSHR